METTFKCGHKKVGNCYVTSEGRVICLKCKRQYARNYSRAGLAPRPKCLLAQVWK